ncbi:Hemolysin, contains CBS domains [Andreprevotia lacus DSM 23236]|jgi:CBS domain containing-hemolysin-like protein|uniref:Polyamine export protein n=1 Tax=Andreprevotia lacus DSM 23236 TaxID=1121001 RepID=A0A1W1XRE7_9NEIS|nr:hemolysin family protein [Andreprevotia lacus]SMC26466.1 Hemolysin, contains CBS domains [Andreprevotia lacus DSM 23236]
MSPGQTLLALLLLVLASAFFSIAEISLAAARKFKLHALAEQGNANAARVLALQEKPGDFFTVVQVAVNAVAILGGIVGEAGFTPAVTQTLLAAGLTEPLAGRLGFLVAFLLTITLFIQFADLIPKRLGLLMPERMALLVVRPMLLCALLLRPLVWLFDGIANLCFRLFGLPASRSDAITSEEIVAMVDAGTVAGTVLKEEHRVIENLFELGERWVTSAMTPRDQVVFFALTEAPEAIRAKIVAEPHSKYLLCEAGIDSAFAYLDAKHLLQLLLGEPQADLLTDLRRLAVQPLLAVPDTLSLSELLERFKESGEDFALIVNEYALVVGVITLGDVTGQLMGGLLAPLEDEQIVQRDASSWLIDGITPIEDVMRALSLDALPDEEMYETLAGFLMVQLKRMPRKAEAIDCAGYRFEVVDIDHHRIDQILVTRLPVGG